MRLTPALPILLALLLLASCSGQTAARKPPRSAEPGPAPAAGGLTHMGRGVYGATLTEGFELRVIPRDHLPAVTVALVVPAGGVHGPAAPVLAHRLTAPFEDALEGIGGKPSVEAGDDLTVFHGTVPHRRWKDALSLVMGVLKASPDTSPPYEKLPYAHVARPGKLWCEDPAEVFASFYRLPPAAGKIALAVSGPVRPETVRREATRLLPTGPPGAPFPHEARPYRAFASSGMQPRFALGVPAPSYWGPESAATVVLSRLLNGPLGERVAARSGLSNMESTFESGAMGGLLVLRSEAPGELVETAQVLLETLEILDPSEPGIGRELVVARSSLRLDYLDELSTAEGRTLHVAAQASRGRGIPWDRLQAFSGVDAESAAHPPGVAWGGDLQLRTWGEQDSSPAAFEELLAARRGAVAPLWSPSSTGIAPPPSPPGPLRRDLPATPQGALLLHQEDGTLPVAAAALRFATSREARGWAPLLVSAALAEAGSPPPGIRWKGSYGRDRVGFDLWGDPLQIGEAGSRLLSALERGPGEESLEQARRALATVARFEGNNAVYRAREMARAAAFAGHQYGYPPTGAPGPVAEATTADLKREAGSLPGGALVVSLVGDLDRDQALRVAGAWGSAFPGAPGDADGPGPVPENVAARSGPGRGSTSCQVLGFRTGGRLANPLHGANLLLPGLLEQPGSVLRTALAETGRSLGWVRHEVHDQAGLLLILTYPPPGEEEADRRRVVGALAAMASRPPDMQALEREKERLDLQGLAGRSAMERAAMWAELGGPDPEPWRNVTPEQVRLAVERMLARPGPAVGLVRGLGEAPSWPRPEPRP